MRPRKSPFIRGTNKTELCRNKVGPEWKRAAPFFSQSRATTCIRPCMDEKKQRSGRESHTGPTLPERLYFRTCRNRHDL